MNSRTTKSTKWPVRPAKTQINLGICPVWSVFAVRMKEHWVLSYPLSTLRRLWSAWTFHQSGQMSRLIWVFAGCTCHFVGFVVQQLIFSQTGFSLDHWHCLMITGTVWWSMALSDDQWHCAMIWEFLPFVAISQGELRRQSRSSFTRTWWTGTWGCVSAPGTWGGISAPGTWGDVSAQPHLRSFVCHRFP